MTAFPHANTACARWRGEGVSDMRLRKAVRLWRCWFQHDWEFVQDTFQTTNRQGAVVIAWKQCRRCAKSRLIHILR